MSLVLLVFLDMVESAGAQCTWPEVKISLLSKKRRGYCASRTHWRQFNIFISSPAALPAAPPTAKKHQISSQTANSRMLPWSFLTSERYSHHSELRRRKESTPEEPYVVLLLDAKRRVSGVYACEIRLPLFLTPKTSLLTQLITVLQLFGVSWDMCLVFLFLPALGYQI